MQFLWQPLPSPWTASVVVREERIPGKRKNDKLEGKGNIGKEAQELRLTFDPGWRRENCHLDLTRPSCLVPHSYLSLSLSLTFVFSHSLSLMPWLKLRRVWLHSPPGIAFFLVLHCYYLPRTAIELRSWLRSYRFSSTTQHKMIDFFCNISKQNFVPKAGDADGNLFLLCAYWDPSNH